jgi:hypothetical protein
MIVEADHAGARDGPSTLYLAPRSRPYSHTPHGCTGGLQVGPALCVYLTVANGPNLNRITLYFPFGSDPA